MAMVGQVSKHEARAPDGTSLSYRRRQGKEGAQRALLIHSLAMTGSFWDETVAALGGDWDVIAVDCRGHGASDKPAGPYTVDTMADDVAVVLDAAGWQSALVAGASMGGCIALAFAARHPARCQGLGLFDTTAWYGDGAEEAWEGRARKALDEGLSALVGFQKTRWFGDAFREARPEVVESAIEVFLANDVAAYAETCRMLGRSDQRAGLAKLAMPVEIVVGEEDYATPPAMAQAMHEVIANSSLTVLPGMRHFTPLEAPEVIATHLATLAGKVK